MTVSTWCCQEYDQGWAEGGVATTSAGGIVVLARDVALTHVTAFVEAAARSELTPASSLPPDGG